MKKRQARKRTEAEQNRMETPAAADGAGTEVRTWDGLPVRYDAGVCPNCGSSRNVIEKTGAGDLTTYGRARILRKHHCQNCGLYFQTEQVVNPVDVPHVRMARA